MAVTAVGGVVAVCLLEERCSELFTFTFWKSAISLLLLTTTMSPTPPSKRHHLPFAMDGKSYRTSMSQRCGGKLNQVFLATCVASFFLQLFASFVSWNGGHSISSGEILLMEPPQLRLGNDARKLSVDTGYAAEQEAVEPESAQAPESTAAQLPPNRALGPPPHSRRLRVLMGIVTADFKNDHAYRKRHRSLFGLWNDPRVCSLPDFKSLPVEERYECEIIYTFVMGANPEASPELVDDSRPPEVTRPIKGLCPDLNEPDMTLLNIRENMNGKFKDKTIFVFVHPPPPPLTHLIIFSHRGQVADLDEVWSRHCRRV